MKKLVIAFMVISFSSNYAQVKFEDYFLDKQLRFDYYHSGNAENDFYTFDELIEEPHWGGSRVNLIDSIGYGNYMFSVSDFETGYLIYSRGYSTLFQEWQTTGEAKYIERSFSETLIFPYPKDSIKIEIFDRDAKNEFRKRFEMIVDPDNYFIVKEKKCPSDYFKVHISGYSSKKLDIVFLPEGYSNLEKDKFHKDCLKFADYLFEYEPFSQNKDNINIWGIDAYTKDSGIDIPADSIWKNSILNSSFYTFNSERYLMTMDNKSVRNYASNVPYDQIYILVNTDKYGGGAIYNYYSTAAVDNRLSKNIFIHEFGHGLAGLADEYYTSDVAYQNFYPLEVEPWEPNITTLVNFDLKWKSLLNEEIQIPTKIDSSSPLKTGVYEGGGYVAKGVYRSTPSSLMKGWDVDEFNEVSKRAILKIIEFYSK